MPSFLRALFAGASGASYGLVVLVVAAGLTFRVVPALAESSTAPNACQELQLTSCEGKARLATCEGCDGPTCGCVETVCSVDGGPARGPLVCLRLYGCRESLPGFDLAPCDAKREGESCATGKVCRAVGISCAEDLDDAGVYRTYRPRLACVPGEPFTPDAGTPSGSSSSSTSSGAAPASSPPAEGDGCAVATSGTSSPAAPLTLAGAASLAIAWMLRRRRRG